MKGGLRAEYEAQTGKTLPATASEVRKAIRAEIARRASVPDTMPGDGAQSQHDAVQANAPNVM